MKKILHAFVGFDLILSQIKLNTVCALCILCFGLLPAISWSQTSISAVGTNYTQDFNTLTSGTWADNTTATGWYTATTATASITTYSANTGSTTTAGLYAFGVAGAGLLSDRGLGFVTSNAYTGAASSGKNYMGWRLKNTTGSAISSLAVTWTGEQWRNNNNTSAQQLVLTYQQAATVTSVSAGTWTTTTSTFSSLQNTATAATLDGNASANRTANITITISVNIPAGEEIMLRWEDLNDTGNDHSLAIDDVTVSVPSVIPTLTATPSTLTFSTTQTVNTPTTGQTFSLTGTNLTGAPGTITVTAPTHFEVSNNGTTWGTSTTIAYSAATLTGSNNVHVRFNPTSAGAKTGNITFSGGGVTTPPTVAVTGTGVTPVLTVPVATAATAISSSGFTANWDAVAGATGYFLDVSTSSTFGAGGLATAIEEFDAAPTAPSGWTFTSIASYSSTGYYGAAANSAKFDGTGDQIVSPTAAGTVTQLKFWMRGASITGASALLVEGYNGTSWVTVQNITPISNTAATMTYNASSSPALPSNLIQFRFTYTKSGGNVAFDDYTVTYNSSTPFFIPGYNNQPISGTSEILTGLDPLTTYYYRVRATNGTPTANSNTISVTTTCAALAVVTSPGATSMCAGTNTLFYASFGTYNPPTLRWQVDPNTGVWADVVLSGVYSINPSDGPEFLNLTNVPASYNNYKYRLVANNGCDNFSAAATLTVNPSPATPTITGANAVCMGSSLSLMGSATSGVSAWLTSAGGVATVNSSGLVLPVSAGMTTITYRVTEAGCSSEITQVVTVNAIPTLSVHNPAAVCSPATVDLTDAAVTTGSSVGATFSYYAIANGFVGFSNPTMVANSTTAYLKATLNGCSTSSPYTAVTVTINPGANIVAPADATICPGSSLNLTATTSNGSTYGWSNGATTMLASPAVTTTYTVTATLGSCNASDDVVIAISTPSLTGGSASNMSAQCQDGNWSYYGSSSSNLFFGIEWGGANATIKDDARVDVMLNPAMYMQESGNDAMYVMKRSWDVHHQAGGALTLLAPVNIRFFFDQAEKDEVTTAAAAYLSAHPGTARPFAWFKTNDGTGAFNSSMLAATGLSGCYILPSATEGTMNGIKYVEITGVTGFSGGSAGAGVGGATILPVTLANFRATKKQQSIELQWKTASEQNANRFIVEKSTDGIHFKAMAEVTAVGNSKEAQTYNQLDKNPSQGDNYYRLLLKDNDGSSRHIGNIVKVNFLDANSVVSIYPNPVSDALTVQTSQTEAANLQLRIMDISGQLIQTIEYNVEQGNNSKILDVHTLRAGTYLLQVVDENQAQVSISRFVKM
jgi:Secretion system C-terminal sorting domain